jgi:type III secretory pathway component EscT
VVSGALVNSAAAAQSLALMLLLCARVVPLAWFATRAGLRGVPLLSVALTLVLALCLFPSAASAAPALPSGVWALLALSLREALLGLVYALALALPLIALTWSGQLAGRMSGVAGADATLGTLQQWVGLAAFFALGGHRVAIDVLAQGLIARPLGALSSGNTLANVGGLALGSARLLADAFASALLIALPVGAALLLAELASALSVRAASAPFVSFAIVPARAALLLFVLCVVALFSLSALPDFFRHGLSGAQHLLGAP